MTETAPAAMRDTPQSPGEIGALALGLKARAGETADVGFSEMSRGRLFDPEQTTIRSALGASAAPNLNVGSPAGRDWLHATRCGLCFDHALTVPMMLSFGPSWQRELWASPYRLRFALAQGENDVSMFASAFDRARALARAAVQGERPFAVVAAHPDPSKEMAASWRCWADGEPFATLEQMGVATSSFEASWLGHVYPDDGADDEFQAWKHRALEVDWDQADILLWSNIAHDIGVLPQAPVVSKLVDLKRGVVVYAYDDRGLDITALSAEPIAGLYTMFDSWLLDHDRARMAAVFA